MSAGFPPGTYYGIPDFGAKADQAQNFEAQSLQMRALLQQIEQNKAAFGSQMEDRQARSRMAAMAAERMASLGPQGQYWASIINRDPGAALAYAEQYGGLGKIEESIRGAEAAAQARMAAEQSIGSMGLSKDDEQLYRSILSQTGNPADALKAFIGVKNANKPGKGTRLSVGPNGEVTFEDGNLTELTGASKSKIQGKLIDAGDMLGRIQSIRDSFQPHFQKWSTKFRTKWNEIKDSMGVDLPATDQAQLEDMSQFQANAFESMSEVLHQLSGAAISPAEEERLKKFLPDPGTGVFDGDSPAKFNAKLDAFEKRVRGYVDRYRTARERGVDPWDMPMTIPSSSHGSGDNSGRNDGGKRTIGGIPHVMKGGKWVPANP